MGLKFRLRGLAETFVDEIECPCCHSRGIEDHEFGTEFTRVTFEGIIVVVQCRTCRQIFVPKSQRLGILNPSALRQAVIQDSEETGEPLFATLASVQFSAERLNAMRKGDLH